ncbi:MAG TPA: TIM barrel protein [Methanocella sp.]|nr:TIM barrel protein [Methanocella sp.]
MTGKIQIGIAGIPHGTKGKGTDAGIRHLHEIGLDAMEIQFGRNVYMSADSARKIASVAEKEGVDLSVHAPYYVNLTSKSEKTREKSREWILMSARIANALDASMVTIHAAREVDIDTVAESFKDITKILKDEGISVPLGVETMGDQGEFGSVSDVLEVMKKAKGTDIVLDFAHIHARTNGGLKTAEDFTAVFDHVAKVKKNNYHIHFSGIEYKNSKEVRHLPLGNGPDFSVLSKVLLERDCDAMIICESPLLEEDGLKMKQMIESIQG